MNTHSQESSIHSGEWEINENYVHCNMKSKDDIIQSLQQQIYNLTNKINVSKETQTERIFIDTSTQTHQNNVLRRDIGIQVTEMKRIEGNATDDFIIKYHLLRQKIPFGFSPILSRELTNYTTHSTSHSQETKKEIFE